MQNLKRRLIRADQLNELGVDFHRNHIAKLVREGRFPKPIKFGTGRMASAYYVVDEILEHIEKLIAERDSKAAA